MVEGQNLLTLLNVSGFRYGQTFLLKTGKHLVVRPVPNVHANPLTAQALGSNRSSSATTERVEDYFTLVATGPDYPLVQLQRLLRGEAGVFIAIRTGYVSPPILYYFAIRIRPVCPSWRASVSTSKNSSLVIGVVRHSHIVQVESVALTLTVAQNRIVLSRKITLGLTATRIAPHDFIPEIALAEYPVHKSLDVSVGRMVDVKVDTAVIPEYPVHFQQPDTQPAQKKPPCPARRLLWPLQLLPKHRASCP